MPGIGRVIDVAEALRTPSVAVAAERCTHRHHQGSACARCEQVCPAHAITVSADGPAIDAVTCVDCAACAAVCLTGALEPLKPKDSALAEEIATKAKYYNRVTIACAQASLAGSGAVVVPCLARLEASMLLFAFERGASAVSLRAGACDSCSAKPLAWGPSSAVAEAEALIEALRLPSRISVAESAERAEAEEAQAAESVGLSRRGFLEALRRGSAGYAAKAMSVLLPEPAEKAAIAAERPGRRLTAHVPEKRERLLRSLRALSAAPTAPNGSRPIFLAPAIDSVGCSGCAMCGLICPTGALAAERTGGEALRITCQAAACVECGLCVEMCRPGALTLAPVGVERVLGRETGGETLLERAEEEARPLYLSAEDRMRELLGVAIYRT